MEMVYLGLFSSVFKWVFNKILSPVVNFIADLLSTVFNFLFKNVLLPVLEYVFKYVLKWLYDIIMKILGELFYRIFAYLLKLIDYISKGYDIFIGNTDVSYYDTAAKSTKSGSLLEAMFAIDGIGTAFRVITAIGIGIALLVAIYAIIKSTLDFDFENKRPVGAVLRSLFKCLIQFLLVPFMVMIIINIAGIVLSGINTALSSGSNQTLGSMIFYVASLDASKNSSENISHVSNASYDFKQGARGKYLENQSPHIYSNVSQVGKDFDYGDFDYVIGIIVSIFLIIILFVCIITFIQRLFEIIVLYLTAPLFISTTPLDDGEKFGKWRDMFIAKCFTGYGSILAMKLYMIVCPIIIGNSIQFGGNGTSLESTYILKIIFLVGGAWAFLKVGPMITSLLNYQAGMTENQSGAMATGMLMQYVVSPAKSGVASMFKGNKNKKGKKEDSKKDQKPEEKPNEKTQGKSGQAFGQKGDYRQNGGKPQNGVQIGSHSGQASATASRPGQFTGTGSKSGQASGTAGQASGVTGQASGAASKVGQAASAVAKGGK